MDNQKYCNECDNTGIVKTPNDMRKYDAEFDRLDLMGSFSYGECRKKALDVSGYTTEFCTCNIGKHRKALSEYRDSVTKTIDQFEALKKSLDEVKDEARKHEVEGMLGQVRVYLKNVDNELKAFK